MREAILKIIEIQKKEAQSIAEYALLMVVVVGILIVAVNGPIRTALSNTFDGLMDAIKSGVEGLIH